MNWFFFLIWADPGLFFNIFVSHATTQIRTMTFPHLLDRVASSQRWGRPWLISSDFVNDAGPVLDMMLLNLI